MKINIPRYVTDLLALMRRVWSETAGWLVIEDWISDGRMPDPIQPNEEPNAESASNWIHAYLRKVHLSRQAGQSVYLELRCEAQDLMPRVARVALGYGVSVYSGSGMDGLKAKKEAAERAAKRDVPTRIGHLTDLDKSGGDIATAFAEDAIAFNQWHGAWNLTIERLALTEAQAVEHDLLDESGHAEVDGLPVPVLDAIVRDWIEANLNPDIQREVIRREPAMRRKAIRLLSKMRADDDDEGLTDGEDWSWAY
jgi:hypothetical protein